MSIISHIVNLLFPPHCVCCHASLAFPGLCEECQSRGVVYESLRCPVCRGRTPGVRPLCHPRVPYAIAAVGPYESPLSDIVKTLKYRRARSLRQVVAALLQTYKSQIPHDFAGYVVVPIPLHRARLRERGFNQAELIAREVASVFNLPLCRALTRTRATLPQAKLQLRSQRLDNLRGAFVSTDAVSARDVILVDDVYTSGATMREAIKALKQQGARSVVGFVLCQTHR